MSFPRYPKYKESGVEWLGQVPDHWEVKPLWSLFRFSKGLTITKEDLLDEGVPCVNYGEIHSKYGVNLDPDKHPLKCVDPSWLEKQSDALIRKGDFVYADTSEDLEGSGNFTCLINGEPIFAGYHTIIARPRHDLSASFFAHEFHSQPFRCQIQKRVKGIKVFSITQGLLKGICCWQPPLDEQTAIADFLDRETAKIDGLIAEQERLIELLKEKRQGVISHAVTKGLNPDAPMKDSGKEWIGKVPAHWEVKRTKYVVLKNEGIQMGPFGGMLLDLNDADTGFKVYGQENTISGDFSRGSRWISEERFRSLINYHIQIGDLLLTRKGSLGNARLVQMLSQPGIADSDTIRVRVDESLILPTFLALLFHEAEYIAQQLNLAKRGAILPGLNSEIIANIAIVLPSIAQQRDVMAYLDNELGKLNTLTTEAQKAIELLQERRSALLSAAVTGQIDVRGIQHQEAA